MKTCYICDASIEATTSAPEECAECKQELEHLKATNHGLAESYAKRVVK